MKKLPLRFATILLVGLSLAFALHYFTLKGAELPPLADMLMPSYVINYILAVGIFVGLFYSRRKLKNALGFLFMGGSLVKFIVFFLVFYPVYRADGEIQRTEFAAFFIPYLTALILETYFASKMLNQVTEP